MRFLTTLSFGAIAVGALLSFCTASTSCSTAGVNGYTSPPISCSSYHTELASSQKYCYMANQAGVWSSLNFPSETLTCPYGLNVDYFQTNYYDSTSTDGTLSFSFDLNNGGGSDVSDNQAITPGMCVDWTNDFSQNPSLNSVTWGFNSNGGRTHGVLLEYAMWCTQPATSAPTSTPAPTTSSASSASATVSSGSSQSMNSSSSSGSSGSTAQKTGGASTKHALGHGVLAVAIGVAALA